MGCCLSRDKQGDANAELPVVEDTGILHVPAERLADFQARLKGRKLLFVKGFGQDDWGGKGQIDSLNGFIKANNAKMLEEIQGAVKSYQLTKDDFVVVDGDPAKSGFQIFAYWVAKETRCQLIWAKKLPIGFAAMTPEKQKEARDGLIPQVKAWEKELRPFNTTIYFVEISGERQDEEMFKVFGRALVVDGQDRPKFNARMDFFSLGGEMQKNMQDESQFTDETVKAYATQIRKYAEKEKESKGGLEFCAFENAAKGSVIRSVLRPHAGKSLTLLTGGGQATVLEVAASLMTKSIDPKSELLAIPAKRGKDTDPDIPRVIPQLG